ncbi:MAG: phosphoglucomutase/phosphomannomutase family protein [Verrucomicrobiales bacterium]|nr:phosphoglucomutase/phosphomannomutase family protein [Verrucomicrobiales bacterium]
MQPWDVVSCPSGLLMAAKIKFGTDGWRAVIAEDFTFENVSRVAQATADYWKAHPVAGAERKVVVGYDRRFLSDRFARRTAEVMAGNGFAVVLSDAPVPTPAVSLAVKTQKAVGGVMITASHNPAEFNGFKVKASYGGAAETEMCQGIEEVVDASPIKWTAFDHALRGKAVTVRDLRQPHHAACRKLVDFDRIAKSKLRFAHDAMYGVGAGCFEELLAGTSCVVTTLNAEHNPLFGGVSPEPISRNFARSAAWLKEHPHDLCLVTDGDADRVGGMLGDGGVLTTHQIICLLLRHFVVNRKQTGRVVKALTTTTLVDRMCERYGLELVETGVGFKHVAAEMVRGGVLLGFEESGGIGFPGHIPERDGILAGLMLLELLATERKSLAALVSSLGKEFGPFAYARLDNAFPIEKRTSLMEYCKLNTPSKLLKSPVTRIQSADGVKITAQDGSWLMLRGSGTEPILRIYAEARTPADAEKLLQVGVKLTKQV